MATKFTPEQQRAIELRDRNILVCAAAGSGKTAVLVQRIIGLVTDKVSPVDIDRLLVVTFTNAAAAEMRERIGIALGKALEEEPENVHLQKQLSLLHNAQITTIDSFCLFLLRNNFNDIGLDPGFRIADEGELTLLKQDVLAELLEEQYREGRTEFLDCVEYFAGSSNDQMLEEYLTRLYEFSMSYPFPEDWIGQCREEYKISSVTEMENIPWCQFLVSYIRTMTQEWKRDMEEAVSISLRPDGPYMYGELLEKEQEMLEKLSDAERLSDFSARFETVAFGRLPSKKDDTVNPLLRERVQQIRKNIKKGVEDIRNTYFALSMQQALERMQKASAAVTELLSLVLLYKMRLDERKRRDNIIDFHDMEHFALQILLERTQEGGFAASQAAREYRQHFKEILIDEYQDSNLVQELILKSISGEEEEQYNRFMVGDVKQSIYRFRLARPELFMEKYGCYSIDDGPCQRVDLHKNFRSRHQVLSSVNAVFSQIMGKGLGGVEYDEEAALYPGAEFPEAGDSGEEAVDAGMQDEGALEKETLDAEFRGAGAFEGGLTESAEGKGEDPYRTEYLIVGKDESSSLSVREQEAAAVAQKIRKLYGTLQVTDRESGKLRPVRYRDMAILLRTTSGWADEFKQILEKEGIPVYVASRTGYYQTAEIKALLQLLHVIDNPYQDIPLYGTMQSYFGGFSQDEIAEIRAEDKAVPLYELLRNYEGERKEKVQVFLAWLSRYRRKTAYTPIHKLIQEILTDTGYLDYVTARPGGEQRRANVEMLLTRAASFEQTSYYGLFHFLRYVEQLEKYEVDYGEADVMDENADVVRIMSIHKSKGLEFPVCFVSGLAKRFNMQDTTSRLIADVDMGIGVDYVDSALRIQSRTLKKSAVALKMRLDALGEEMRVLYVAMTRAGEKLILTAMTPDADKFEEELQSRRLLEEEKQKYQRGSQEESWEESREENCREGRGKGREDNQEESWGERQEENWGESRREGREDNQEENWRERQKENQGDKQLPIGYEKHRRTAFSALAGASCYLDFLLPCQPDIQLLRPEQLLMQDVEGAAEELQRKQRLLVGEVSQQIMTSLSEKFGKTYPYQYLSGLFVKTTVSELKKKAMHAGTKELENRLDESIDGVGSARGNQAFTREMFEEPEIVPYIPAFISSRDGMSGTDRGSAYHKVMELLDMKAVGEGRVEEEINRQLDLFVKEERLSEQWRNSISVPKVKRFLESSLAKRMRKADSQGKLWREQPFVMGLPAKRLDENCPDTEQVLIQGIIDVFFEEQGKIVVADYKTDAVNEPEELIRRYQVQLDYYKEALEKLTGKEVVEKIIYSFALGKEVSV
ncbi:MAG: UvrD-helicase domain-containing protein [Lachnospiraceae bacterium]|nr:UvrD-helicase domain-containing protein [Lachnospiraceae bacterium]